MHAVPFFLTLLVLFFSAYPFTERFSLALSYPIPFVIPRTGRRPHAAKGRTNIELREQFILADGVSQSMAAFRPRTPRSNTNTPPSTGPITKVSTQTAILEKIFSPTG